MSFGRLNLAALLLGLLSSAAVSQPEPARYRVEQVFRLETVLAQPRAGQENQPPVTTLVEGRFRFVLEQRLNEEEPEFGTWRFTRVELERLRKEPPGGETSAAERALALGLLSMRRLEGKEFTVGVGELPVLPLGEAAPAWLTAWLRWAQMGSFAGVGVNPVNLPAAGEPGGEGGSPPLTYDLRWRRSDFRQQPCHVQEARWTAPTLPAPGAVTPELAAEGVEARTRFSAMSLEWVAQENPALVYAERSALRETFWDLQHVQKPELREMVFRVRLSVQVRIERLS